MEISINNMKVMLCSLCNQNAAINQLIEAGHIFPQGGICFSLIDQDLLDW